MEAALAEMALDDASKEAEDDVDFINEKGMLLLSVFLYWLEQSKYIDEEDVFDMDFESTDDEAAQEDAEVGDKSVQEDEKRQQKVHAFALPIQCYYLKSHCLFRQPAPA
jgi:vacuolar protein sorting-associated protein 72